jgi:dihydrofolate reductase
MRDVVYTAACSLDGFITGRDDAIDWIQFDDEARTHLAAFWPTVDTLLMGRRTYDQMRASGDGPAIPGITASYVFSRTLDRVEGRHMHLVRADAAGVVRSLKAAPGKRLCLFGGGNFARTLFDAGLVDEVDLCVHPVLLGDGVPLVVGGGRRVGLELAEQRTSASGCVFVRYRVVAGPEDRADTSGHGASSAPASR